MIYQQKGVALILALLVVALATTASVALMSDQQLSLRRGSNLLARDQATQYALGAEAWAQIWLKRDAQNNQIDHENEDWATQIPPLPVEGGVIIAQLFDLQGRFNLNNLLNNQGQRDPAQLNRLQNLFAAIDVPVTTAESVADWLDTDLNTAGTGGAEDDFYLNLEHAYRSANQAMQSATEFRLLREVTPEIIEKLQLEEQPPEDPRLMITALPGFTNINVNTAPTAVFQSLGLNKSDAEAIVTQREGDPNQPNSSQPFNSINDFTSIPSVQQANIQASGLGVSSQFFLATIQVNIARSRAILYSIIYRDNDGKTQVISRSYGTL